MPADTDPETTPTEQPAAVPETAPIAPIAVAAPKAKRMSTETEAKQTVIPGTAQNTGVDVATKAVTEMVEANKRAEAFQAELKARDVRELETKTTLAKLQEQILMSEADKKTLAAARAADRVEAEIKAAAIKHSAVNEAQVYKLVADELALAEDGKSVVLKADPKINADTYVKSFLDTNAHLAKPKVGTGSGATLTPGTAPTTAPITIDRNAPGGLNAAFQQSARSFIERNTVTK